VRAVRDKRKSLFSAGIQRVVGDFSAQDAVALCDKAGHEFGRGLVNYSSEASAGAEGWGVGALLRGRGRLAASGI
jgi:glutamate 5-kinase